MFGRRSRSAAPQVPADETSSTPTATTAVMVVDDATFFGLTAGGYTVIDFWAAWCGPCRAFGPIFNEVAEAHQGPVRFGSCDIEAAPRTADLLQIRSIPTLVVFGPDGSEVGRSSGAVPRGDLEATVRQLAGR